MIPRLVLPFRASSSSCHNLHYLADELNGRTEFRFATLQVPARTHRLPHAWMTLHRRVSLRISTILLQAMKLNDLIGLILWAGSDLDVDDVANIHSTERVLCLVDDWVLLVG